MSDTDYRIIIREREDFDIGQILECGQTFRYRRQADGYRVFAGDKTCTVTQSREEAIVACEECDADFWKNYFDLQTDYGVVKRSLRPLPYMEEAIACGKGIRILRQDHWETLICFILSANNRLPRIMGIVDRLCARLGEDCGGYHAFPTPERMARENAAFYRELGAGYRAEYLEKTARAVADGFDLKKLEEADNASARGALRTLAGVGPKVADCILLYGYHRTEAIPVDTWIKKAYAQICADGCRNTEAMRRRLEEIYGSFGGFAQQYLFYYQRQKRDT